MGRLFIPGIRAMSPSSQPESRYCGQPHLPDRLNKINRAMATAADIVIAEVEEIVPVESPIHLIHTQVVWWITCSRCQPFPELLGSQPRSWSWSKVK